MFTDELRIGNWVQRIGFPLKVTGIKGSDVWVDGNGVELEYYIYDGINPIPLTEEWLIKFGFYETSRYGKYLEFNINQEQSLRLPICKHSEKDFWYVLRGSVKIQYVHQLQNLYFALTGDEL